MSIVVKVRRDVAVSIALHPRSRGMRELFRAAEELGVELKQMHPRVKDPVLASYYSVEVADPLEAERIAARFRVCRAAEAVYVKPPDELP